MRSSSNFAPRWSGWRKSQHETVQDVQTGVPDEEDRAETEEGRMSFFRTIGNALRASQQGNPGGRGISSSIREPGPPSLVRGTFQRYIYSPSDTYNAKLCMV